MGKELGGKRVGRGWDEGRLERLLGGLEGGEREVVRDLLVWKGREIFPGRVPWEERVGLNRI